MPRFNKITPNLIVADVDRSLRFYEQVLGFSRAFSVPEQPPFVFVCVAGGDVQIFLNDRSTVARESPQLGGLAFGGGNTMFIETDDVDAVHDLIAAQAPVVMPLVTQWYGMREFAVTDPDGYVITFAQRVER